MKSHVTRALGAQQRGLGRQVLGPVLPEQAQAGLGQDLELLGGDVLRGGQDLHVAGVAPGRGGELVVDALEVGPDARGVQAPDHLRHATPAWRPVTPPSRRWLKKSPGGAHIVHRPLRWSSSTAGGVQLPGGDRGEVERRARRAEAGAQVVADLVAARPGRRADRGGDGRLGAGQRAHGGHRAGQDAAGQPGPAGVDQRDRARGDERDGQAVRRQRGGRGPGVGGGLAVGASPAPPSTVTVVPWTWWPCRIRRPPASAARRRRFSATSAGSSSVQGPRFSVA